MSWFRMAVVALGICSFFDEAWAKDYGKPNRKARDIFRQHFDYRARYSSDAPDYQDIVRRLVKSDEKSAIRFFINALPNYSVGQDKLKLDKVLFGVGIGLTSFAFRDQIQNRWHWQPPDWAKPFRFDLDFNLRDLDSVRGSLVYEW